MAKIEKYQCDQCGALSNGDMSGWWLITGRLVLSIQEIEDCEKGNHYCGRECAMKAISAFMDRVT